MRQSKARATGSSSFAASQIVEAHVVARRRGMGILTYSSPAGGWLSGRWRRNTDAAPTSSARPAARFDMSSPANQQKLNVVDALAQLAAQTGQLSQPIYDYVRQS